MINSNHLLKKKKKKLLVNQTALVALYVYNLLIKETGSNSQLFVNYTTLVTLYCPLLSAACEVNYTDVFLY